MEIIALSGRFVIHDKFFLALKPLWLRSHGTRRIFDLLKIRVFLKVFRSHLNSLTIQKIRVFD